MTSPSCTKAQQRVLKAAAEGNVSRSRHGAWRWLLYPLGRDSVAGQDVTRTANSLLRRGLARKSTEIVNDRIPLAVTADGHELLSKLAHRAR